MTNDSGSQTRGLAALLRELGDEVEEEKRAAMNPADQRLDDIAREILRLERDMKIPGSPVSDSARAERLMRFIEEREF